MRSDPRQQFRGLKIAVLLRATALAVVFLCLDGCRRPSPPAPVAPPAAADSGQPKGRQPVVADSTELGQQLFARHCAACHGERGDGKGIAAAFVFPKPRDLRAGRFRLVSTLNNVPTRDDLRAVLVRGMPGSSMPPWGHLTTEEREALVDQVMRLRREGARDSYIAILQEEDELTDEEIAAADVQKEIQEFADRVTTPGESTVVPEMPAPTYEALVRGKEIYAKIGCIQCHGKEGKGDGVQKMVDYEKLPTAPRDFTLGIFKGGHDPASLYRRTAYGMPGTPMPSSQQVSPEQMIDLIHYIRSLSTEEQREAAVLNRERIVARAVVAIPSLPDDEAWSDAEAVAPRMTPLWWRNDAHPDLRVAAVHDGQSIAVRISWRDETENGHAAQSESFEDAVAMQLFRGESEPFIGMGDPKSPIDVWFWDADRQGEPLAVENLYPNSVVDVYPFSETAAATAELARDGARTADQPDISLPARASGNPIVPTADESGASSLTGGGPGTVTFRPPKSRLVKARGQWKDGRWTVVMTRSLAVDKDEAGVSLTPGQRASAAFALWDGAQQDRDGKKLITIWQDLELEPQP